MSRKQRTIRISGLCQPSDNDDEKEYLAGLTALFAPFGRCRPAFFIGPSVGLICFDNEESVRRALEGTENCRFAGRRISTSLQDKTKKGRSKIDDNRGPKLGPSSLEEEDDEALPIGPRLLTAEEKASLGFDTFVISGNGSTGELDTWQASAFLDDKEIPTNWGSGKLKQWKKEPVRPAEFDEAYDLVRSFAHLGGAIMAVDVEAWEHGDEIIEVGISKVVWQAGNATPPWCKSEHLIVAEHKDLRNGSRLPDAKNKFAFGNSTVLTEFQVAVKLHDHLNLLSEDQPLILLFHNAAAEKKFFEQMNVKLDYSENRATWALLNKFKDGTAKRGPERSEVLILDTQRLYKSFTMGTPDAYDRDEIKLGSLAKALGIRPKFLHNAGNDAQYTLESFMAMLDRRNSELQQLRMQARL